MTELLCVQNFMKSVTALSSATVQLLKLTNRLVALDIFHNEHSYTVALLSQLFSIINHQRCQDGSQE